MSDQLESGRRILAAQPFSVVVGAELARLGDGQAELRIPIRPDLCHQGGFVHGGVICYAADNAMTFAAGSLLGTGVVTAGLSVEYMRPAAGDALIARATVVHAGRNRVVARCDVFTVGQGGERLCAVAQGTAAVAGSAST